MKNIILLILDRSQISLIERADRLFHHPCNPCHMDRPTPRRYLITPKLRVVVSSLSHVTPRFEGLGDTHRATRCRSKGRKRPRESCQCVLVTPTSVALFVLERTNLLGSAMTSEFGKIPNAVLYLPGRVNRNYSRRTLQVEFRECKVRIRC